MKPYILNYSESVKIRPSGLRYDPVTQTNNLPTDWALDSTVFTATIEPSDPDDIQAVSTIVTRTLEPDDNDELLLGTTLITKTLEPIDQDGIDWLYSSDLAAKNSSTLITESIEPADPDGVGSL